MALDPTVYSKQLGLNGPASAAVRVPAGATQALGLGNKTSTPASTSAPAKATEAVKSKGTGLMEALNSYQKN